MSRPRRGWRTAVWALALALLLLWGVVTPSRAQPAQGGCPTAPTLPVATKDFAPTQPNAPQPKGNVYKLKPDDVTSGNRGLDAWEYAIHLQFFYNGAGRSPSRSTDAMVFNDVMVAALRGQDEVRNDVKSSKIAAESDARAMFKELQCGQRGEFTRRSSRVGVPANEDSYGLHLAVGSFSIYWSSSCKIGPKECCVEDTRCESGRAHRAPYECSIAFTIYDNYNFGSATGTGNTGKLKRANPLGWAGTSFDQFGYFTVKTQGVARACIDPATVQTECCKPVAQEPETFVDPGQDPEPAEPPKPQPETPAPTCPECVPISEALGRAKTAVEDARAAIARARALLDANRTSQAQAKAQLDAFEKDVGKGWTASGTDTETGITKSYDATGRDGLVHVTVTTKDGAVAQTYTYPRSKNKAEAGKRVERMKELLGALEDDAKQRGDELTGATQKLAAAEAEVKKLQASLDDCLERCRQKQTHVAPQIDRPASTVPGGRPIMVQPSGGAGLGLGQQSSGPLLGVLVGYRVLPNGYVVFAPEITFGNNNNTIIGLPLGFQYDVPLPGLPHFFAYPRGVLGYAADLFSLDVNGQTFSNTTHAFMFGGAGGAKYVLDDRWIFAVEPVGLTGYVNDNGTGWAYRATLGVGAQLP